MKKIYFFAIALIAFNTNAQIIDDNMESYNTGALGPQASHWTTWSGTEGGAEDGTVTTAQANSGTQSVLIAEGSVQDILLLLGNQVSGIYNIAFSMYVPSGKTGYWNIQESEIPGVQWNADFYVGLTASGGSAGTITHDQSGATIPYPSDTWFDVVMTVDLNASLLSVTVDGLSFLNNVNYPGNILGAVNFFSIDANNRYFLDDVLYEDATLSLDDLEANTFRVYPNPVVNKLNIQSKEAVSTVSIYNVLGKLVYQNSPNTISPSIDMGTFKSGIYFVEVTIGKKTKTVKVIK